MESLEISCRTWLLAQGNKYLSTAADWWEAVAIWFLKGLSSPNGWESQRERWTEKISLSVHNAFLRYYNALLQGAAWSYFLVLPSGEVMCRMCLSHKSLLGTSSIITETVRPKYPWHYRESPSLFTFPPLKVKMSEMPEVCSSQMLVATSIK